METSDVQFKAFIRMVQLKMNEALDAPTVEEKDDIIKSIADIFQRTLED